jgi:hypothetical protein
LRGIGAEEVAIFDPFFGLKLFDNAFLILFTLAIVDILTLINLQPALLDDIPNIRVFLNYNITLFLVFVVQVVID